jgi:hypothetical protein
VSFYARFTCHAQGQRPRKRAAKVMCVAPVYLRAVLMLAGMALALLGPTSVVQAQSERTVTSGDVARMAATKKPTSIKRILVPEDRPTAWLRPPLVAIDRQEFEALYRSALPVAPAPPPAAIVSAEYSATIVADTMRGGQLTWQVERTSEEQVVLALEPWNAAVGELEWGSASANWGSGPDGRTFLYVDRPSGEVKGQWSLRGVATPRSTEFALEFPAAATTRFTFRYPRGMRLEVAGSVPESSTIEGEWSLDRFSLGAATSTRVSLLAATSQAPATAKLAYESELEAIVTEDDVRFQAGFQVDVLEAPVSELTFSLSPGLDVYSITYGGELPLAWTQSESSESRNLITVRLPGKLQGRGRVIRFDGLSVAKTGLANASLTLPQIMLEGALFLGGQQSLTVAPTLQLRNLRTRGLKQIAPVMTNAAGETHVFQRRSADAQLTADIRRPQAAPACSILSWLQPGDDAWILKAELNWTIASGSLFQTSCKIPADWEITDVRPLGVDRAAEQSSWEVQPQAGGGSLLHVEFAEPLQVGVSRSIQLEARLRPPAAGQRVGLPIPIPVGAENVAHLVVLSQTPSVSLALVDSSRFEGVSLTGIGEQWRGLKLFTEAQAGPAADIRWWRPLDEEPAGNVVAQPRLRPVDARAHVAAAIDQEGMRQTYYVQCASPGEQLDRLLVYVSQSTEHVAWKLVSPRTENLQAAKLPKDQHSAWGYPDSGDLWELTLPAIAEAKLRIEGSVDPQFAGEGSASVTAVSTEAEADSPSNQVGLVFVPQARTFRASVSVESLLADLPRTETRGLEPETELAVSEVLFSGDAQSLRRKLWSYSAPRNRLWFETREHPLADKPALKATLHLRSLISANTSGADLHRARYDILSDAGAGAMMLRLPASAMFLAAKVNDETVSALRTDGGWMILEPATSGQWSSIEILYQVKAEQPGLVDRRQIVLPDLGMTVLTFRWEFALPPAAGMTKEPVGVLLSSPITQPTWMTRLFGPLGRGANSGFFNPFMVPSYRQLWSEPEEVSLVGTQFGSSVTVPAGWVVYRGESVEPPARLELETWSLPQLQTLSWTFLLFSLTTGVIVRKLRWRYRAWGAVWWMAGCLSIALFGPALVAPLAGGGMAGTILSLLLPRRTWQVSLLQPGEIPPPESSWNYLGRQEVAGIGAILFVAGSIGNASLSAQTGDPVTRVGEAAREGQDGQIEAVYIPVDREGKPSSRLPVVYAHPDLLSELEGLAAKQQTSAEWLLSHADYRGKVGQQGTVVLSARWNVTRLNPALPMRLELPVTNANLGGRSACLVDGKPFPVLPAATGGGVVIELPAATSIASVVKPTDKKERSRQEPLRHDVLLELHQPGTNASRGGQFETGIPRVANARLLLEFDRQYGEVKIASAKGEVQASIDRMAVSAELGPTSALRVSWSSEPSLTKTTAVAEGRMLNLLELKAGTALLSFRGLVRPIEEGLRLVSISLPPNSILKDFRCKQALRYQLEELPGMARRMSIELPPGKQSEFELAGEVYVPLDINLRSDVTLPRAALIATEECQWAGMLDLYGVIAGNEFKLDPGMTTDDFGFAAIPVDDFARQWSDGISGTRPALAFRLDGATGPVVSLATRVFKKRAIKWQQQARVGKRRIDWKLVADVETSGAPSFSHSFLIDRRLQIESISVMEAGAERLVRWAESRLNGNQNRVVLFLADKTQSLQTVTIKAHQPLRTKTELAWPWARPEETDVVDQRLIVTYEPEFLVEIKPHRSLKPVDLKAEPVASVDGATVLGSWRVLEEEPGGGMTIIPVNGRARAVALHSVTAAEAGTWKWQQQIQLIPEDEGMSGFRIRVDNPPADFVATSSIGNVQTTRLDDGQLQILIQPEDRIDLPVTLTLRATLKATLETLRLPAVQVLELGAIEEYVAIAMEATTVEPRSARLLTSPDDHPLAVIDLLETGGMTDTVRLYETAPGPIELSTVRRNAGPSGLTVRYVEHFVAVDHAGRIAGETKIYLGAASGLLPVLVRSDCEIRAAFINEQPVALLTSQHGEVQLPLDAAPAECVVAIHWGTRPTTFWYWYGDSNIQLPVPMLAGYKSESGGEPPWMSVALFTTSDQFLLGSSLAGSSTQTPLRQAIDRLNVLVTQWRAVPADSAAASALANLVYQKVEQISARIPAIVAERLGPSASDLAEWQRVVDEIAIARLKVPPVGKGVDDRTGADTFSLGVQDIATRHTTVLRRLPLQLINLPIVRSYTLNDWLAMLIVLGVVSLIAQQLLSRLVRLEAGEWLGQHARLGWCLVGLFWWCCLTPSILGLGIVVASLIRAVYVRVQSRRQVRMIS